MEADPADLHAGRCRIAPGRRGCAAITEPPCSGSGAIAFYAGGGFYYDSGWWSRTVSGVPMFMAWGYDGQFAYVIPSLNVTLVTTENTKDNTGPFKEVNSGKFMQNYLLPSIGGLSAGARSPRLRERSGSRPGDRDPD